MQEYIAAGGLDFVTIAQFFQVSAAETTEIVTEEFSLMSLVTRAGPVVKAVMACLLGMSVWSWAIAIDKWLSMSAANKKAKAFETAFWSGQSLDDMDDRIGDKPSDALARVFSSGSREWRESRRLRTMTDSVAGALMDRARTQMNVAVGKETSRMEGGLTTLAIIGSSAPFIGLFGTVWGIMNSFRSIAAARETNLAVVAPGIAEALFATGLGLLAAIPATIFYNKFSSDIGKFGEHMDAFSEEFAVRLSRRLAERLDD